MSESVLFSVLIANYNNGKYLQDAIDSVFAQTYPNWEIVIVDDCSTDNSKEVYGKYKEDERIRVFVNETNQGCGYTKRRCAELAKGQLCGFLDADDMLLPDALETMVEIHRQHPEISLVFSRFYRCDEQMNITGENRELVIADGKNYFTNQDYSPEHFVAFKKSAYDRTDGIDQVLQMGVDQDLYFRLEEADPCFVLNQFTYKYRVATNSVSRREPVECTWWNTMVRYEAARRRNLPPKEYSYGPFKAGVDEVFESTNREIARLKGTWSYRIGHAILSPFYQIIKWLGKK